VARFRKIDVKIWGDEKFRALSRPQPNARDCFLHLLTNRETTSIPGVYRAYEEGLARDLEWSVEDYRKVFREVSGKGLAKADWKAGLVFVPNVIKHNPPESPNVVRGWWKVWDEIPECSLKQEAYQHLKVFIEDFAKGKRGFLDAFRQPSPNQEQEQEQDQEQDQIETSSLAQPASPPAGAGGSEAPGPLEPPGMPGNGTAPPSPKRQRKAHDFDPRLLEVYRLFPRKEGRTKGLLKLKKQIVTLGQYEKLLAAVKSYAAKMSGKEAEFVKHFSTWADEKCWVDDVPTAQESESNDVARARLARLGSEDMAGGKA
jgi:hypothetical protein